MEQGVEKINLSRKRTCIQSWKIAFHWFGKKRGAESVGKRQKHDQDSLFWGISEVQSSNIKFKRDKLADSEGIHEKGGEIEGERKGKGGGGIKGTSFGKSDCPFCSIKLQDEFEKEQN